MKDLFVIIMVIITLGLGIRWMHSEFKEINQHRKEWNEKVNNCILNPNYRSDCKLIIYKDMQNHNMQMQEKQQTSVMTGSMVGSMIGSSLVRR